MSQDYCLLPNCDNLSVLTCDLCRNTMCIVCTNFLELKIEFYKEYNQSADHWACIICFVNVLQEIIIER